MIKKTKNSNDYILTKTDDIWVRDFTKQTVKPFDINNLIPLEDQKLMLENEIKNQEKIYQGLDTEDFSHDKIVIIGDGDQFEENIQRIPEGVTVIGVNRAFARWPKNKRLNYYVVNNPYPECIYNYPEIITNWPKCISSTRTYPQFLYNYRGLVYLYSPVNNGYYSGVKSEHSLLIDDYRSSICAAINLSYKFKVKKLLLLSLLETYDNRPGCENGLYPQQKMVHSLIDANLYWMKRINIGHCNDKLIYENAAYIKDIKGFFDGRT